MAIDWNSIRPLNNSKNDGFEELVCQLAARTVTPGQKQFVRIGKPDGGKECYWELGNGDCHQWQAKYFTDSLTAGQWTQIEKSVLSAIDNHPRLTRYTIAIPIDRPDGKTKGASSMLAKWNKKKTEWESYASKKGRTLSIEFWGSHEMTLLLSRLENAGLIYFWFNKDEFSDQWFDAKNQESVTALGSRYTNYLHLELDIAKDFAGLSRNQSFVKKFHSLYNKVIEEFRQLSMDEHAELKAPFETVATTVKRFRTFFEAIPLTGKETLPLSAIIHYCNELTDHTRKLQSILYKKSEEKRDPKNPVSPYQSKPFNKEINSLSDFQDALISFRDFTQSPTCALANHPYLILTGKAGMGKSHLLGDIITNRKKEGHLSLLFLGENFSTRELPWTQLLKNHLRKNQLDEFTFLGAINAKAESKQSRIVFFIDAINEGEGVMIWPRHLRSFINSFKSFPWLGLVVSIRSSYEKLIAPIETIDRSTAVRLRHQGFAGVEYEAARLFFSYYKIMQPAAPLLNPEFQNPLFLKLFCKSLFDRKMHSIPPGYEGITTIINYFLDSVNYKLSLPDQLYYEERKNLVQKAVAAIITKIVESGKDFLDYTTCDEIIDGYFNSHCSNKEPFLKRLISEEVFNVDLHWSKDGQQTEVVYFAYQRFHDHLKVSLLLDKYLDAADPVSSFAAGPLHEIVNKPFFGYYQNIIEALTIQLPERIGKELFEVAPFAKNYETIAEAFIDSLIWRRNETIGTPAENYVNEVIMEDDELADRFMEEIISISVKSGHPFNAWSIHRRLIKASLTERDHVWTTWLQDKYGPDAEPNAIKRLIDWAWQEEDKSHISDEAAKLAAITLSWCLTSSNRYLRDAATKSLVSLLQNRTTILQELLKMFEEVNDLYVAERLYAVAYGCTLRKQAPDITDILLCQYIYTAIFDKKMVVPHILIRDYARGIIEYALHNKVSLPIDVSKIRPPYRSRKLPRRLPSINSIDRKFKPKRDNGNYGKPGWGSTAIFSSMTTEYGRGTAQYGDFGRYVFQRAFDDWDVDSDGLSNYAITLIFKLGYDPKLFGAFDGKQGSGRGTGHKERIGKKYQWIVFFELLARVADHCVLSDESDWEKKSALTYDGPWYPYVRDIDPTILLWQTQRERYEGYTPGWRFNADYIPAAISHKTWVQDLSDLPDLKQIIQVTDSLQQPWLWLELEPDWTEKEKLGEDRYNTNRKRLWYQLRSYLILSEEVPAFKNAIENKSIDGMPEVQNLHHVFSREFYWSNAYAFFSRAYYSGQQMTAVHNRKTGARLFSVMRTTEYFNWEEEFDCSKLSSIGFYKPTAILKEGLSVKPAEKEGEFCDSKGDIICLDPSVNNPSMAELFLRQDKLKEFLNKSQLSIVWWATGEKQILGSHFKRGEYPGRMMLNGFYELKDDRLEGKITGKIYNG